MDNNAQDRRDYLNRRAAAIYEDLRLLEKSTPKNAWRIQACRFMLNDIAFTTTDLDRYERSISALENAVVKMRQDIQT